MALMIHAGKCFVCEWTCFPQSLWHSQTEACFMIDELLASFLNIISHYERNRVIQEDFSESISRHFNNVLKESCHFHVNSYNHHLWSLLQILCLVNRFYPYFKVYLYKTILDLLWCVMLCQLLLFIQDSIGVIDGMHVPAHQPAKDQSRFRNKKGVLSQNILAVCTFDLQFTFIYPGGEGSVADSRLSRAVLDDPDQNFPSIPEGSLTHTTCSSLCTSTVLMRLCIICTHFS